MPDPVTRELTLIHEPHRSPLDTFAKWLPRLAVALIFLSVGPQKFATNGMWVPIFARIGLGDWFRYLTGTMQIGGAVLVLVPRTCLVGLAVLAATMVGAAATWIVIFHQPFAAIVPGSLLIGLAVIAWPEITRC